MSEQVTFTLNGKPIEADADSTILEAAHKAGVYIPRLCHKDGFEPWASCRICTVTVNGRPCSACTQPVGADTVVETNSDALQDYRRNLIEMLFVEGNHFCMFCEKSGNCELQALAYRFGITAPRFPYFATEREVDATHPDILLDRNRCVLCARCVRASATLDGKSVFNFVGRGAEKQIAVNAEAGLVGTNAEAADLAVDACPVGALLHKRVGFRVPIGERLYDKDPIGTEIEKQT